MHILTWIKNKFGPETWTVFAEEEANMHVERFGFPLFTIPAVLIKEESNKGNKRYWIKELEGGFKNKPYLVCLETMRPLNERELLKTKA